MDYMGRIINEVPIQCFFSRSLIRRPVSSQLSSLPRTQHAMLCSILRCTTSSFFTCDWVSGPHLQPVDNINVTVAFNSLSLNLILRYRQGIKPSPCMAIVWLVLNYPSASGMTASLKIFRHHSRPEYAAKQYITIMDGVFVHAKQRKMYECGLT